jgi:hypothetical protein
VNYHVFWLPAAEAELATVWAASARRDAVTQAAADLDRRLAANGPTEGESRTGRRRIAVSHPLAVIFQVDETLRTVAVIRVWEYR